jgi:hypothetical protein
MYNELKLMQWYFFFNQKDKTSIDAPLYFQIDSITNTKVKIT